MRAGFRLLGQLILMGVCFAVLTSSMLIPFFLLGSAAVPTLLFSQFASVLAVTVSVYLARRLLDRKSFSSLGLRLGKTALQDVLAGFLIAAALIGVIYLIEWGAGWLDFQGFSWQAEPFTQVTAEVLVMLLVFLAGSWQEELLHRGYWLQNVEEGLNLLWGVLISSTFFSLTHLGNPGISWEAVLGLLAGGIFLSYGYIRTRQLWLPIGLHLGWNFFEGTVFGYPVSGLSGMPVLIRQSANGPVWVTGGAFGPEAGLVLLPGLLVGALLVHLYTRSRPVPSAHGT
ncbi:MAG: CPBP family intramembrane glutamic endopeptidase [Anaerolineales bacterium]